MKIVHNLSEQELEEKDIYDAIDNDIEDVKLFIENGANIKNPDDYEGPLCYAYGLNENLERINIMKLLLEGGADPDYFNSGINIETLLFKVIRDGDDEVFELLLERGASIENTDYECMTPLHIASKCGRNEYVRLLLEKGANIEHRDVDGKTPLHAAKNEETMKILLNWGANIDSKDDYNPYTGNGGNTPLWSLVRIKKTTIGIKLLLNEGANIYDEDGSTPLHYASFCGDYDIVKVLLENGVNVEDKDDEGKTAKDFAKGEIMNLFEKFDKSTTIQCFVRTAMAKDISNKRRAEPDNLFDPEFSSKRKKLLNIDDSRFN